MDKIDLEELERLAEQATPGPWYPAKNHTAYDGYGDSVCTTEQTHNLDNNLTYIVAACNAVPGLIARVRELERQREFFIKALKANSLCPGRGCFDGSELDEWECSAENNGKCWIQAAEEAGV